MSNEIIKYIAQCGFLSTAPGVPQIEDPSGNWSAIAISSLITDPNIRYVSKAGNDATGTGALGAPFLTIQAAINACIAAGPTSSNCFEVRVSPGTYATPFKLTANVFVIGSGSAPGSFLATPLNGLTVVTPDPVNILDASLGGAAIAATGIFNCSFAADFICNWALIASTNSSRLILGECMTQNALTFTGNNSLNFLTLRQLYISEGATVDLTLNNLGGGTIDAVTGDGNLVINQTSGTAVYTLSGTTSQLTVNTPAASTFSVIATMLEFSVGDVAITGTGALLVGDVNHNQVLTDVNQILGFGFTAGATCMGVSGAQNVLEMTPSANRTLSLNAPAGSGFAGTGSPTFLTIKNFSPTFNIDFIFPGFVNGFGPSYVPPLGQVTLWFKRVNWCATPNVQSGIVALVNGVSAFIPADVTANSSIVATLQTYNGVCGTPMVPTADRVVGTRSGGGGFKVHAITPATGANTATDQGTYNWQVSS